VTINEIFPYPTVKQVIFQIRFNPLFYLGDRMGEFQQKIMNEFPESSLIVKTPTFTFTSDTKTQEKIQFETESDPNLKIWQFKSKNGVVLNVEKNSLSLTSEFHKTYQLGSGERFRDLIEVVLNNFFEITKIPIIKRIGLRYIDECPIPSKTNAKFKEYYNTSFPLNRFDLRNVEEMLVTSLVKKKECNLRYIETLQKTDNKYKLILDFDAFQNDVDSTDYLTVTDILHTIISDEYEKTIKKPVYDYMKKKH
jgi:uncharacterized protein (TIGR04255 family)